MKKIISGFLDLTMLFSVVACGSSTDKPITWNSTSEPPELFSVMTTTTGSGDVLLHVMDGLTQLDANDVPQPAIAKSWDVSEDGTKYTFHLRDDAKWSNGEKVTAQDFVFAYNLLFDPNTAAPYSGTWAPLIKGAEDVINLQNDYPNAKVPADKVEEALKKVGYKAIDDYTLEFELTGPYEFFPGVLAFYSFLPLNEKGFNDAGGLDKYAKDADKMVFNGAFEISQWDHDSKITFKKRADYYDADKVKSDEFVFKMIGDANTAMNEYQAGDLDITNINGQQFQDLTKKGDKVYSFDDGSCWYLEFNTTQDGLNNMKIRKALTLAIDAQKYVDKVVLNDSKVANSFVPNAIVQGSFTKQVGDLMNRPTGTDYSAVVKMFEEGLAEAGLTRDTFKPEMITDDTSTAKLYGAYIKEQMKTILGIDLTISEMPYKSRIERMQSKDFSIVMSGWGPDYNDPMTFLDLFQSTNGNNHTSWANEKYDQLVLDARAEVDPAKRDAIMLEMEKILAEESPIGYIYNRSLSYVVNERVSGATRSAFNNINLKYAEIKK